MEKIGEYKVHPLASKLPLIQGQEYEDLKRSIEVDGLIEPILILSEKDKTIIDGRNRMRACIDTQTKPHFITLDDECRRIEKHQKDLDSIEDKSLLQAFQQGTDEDVIRELIILKNIYRRQLNTYVDLRNLTAVSEFVENGEVGNGKPKSRCVPGTHLLLNDKSDLSKKHIGKKNSAPQHLWTIWALWTKWTVWTIWTMDNVDDVDKLAIPSIIVLFSETR